MWSGAHTVTRRVRVLVQEALHAAGPVRAPEEAPACTALYTTCVLDADAAVARAHLCPAHVSHMACELLMRAAQDRAWGAVFEGRATAAAH